MKNRPIISCPTFCLLNLPSVDVRGNRYTFTTHRSGLLGLVWCTWYQLTCPMVSPSRGQKSEGGADTDRIKHAEGVASLSGSSECHEQPGHLLSVSTISPASPATKSYPQNCYSSMQNLWPNIGHVQIKTALRAFCLFAFVSCKMYKTFIGSMNWSTPTPEKRTPRSHLPIMLWRTLLEPNAYSCRLLWTL